MSKIFNLFLLAILLVFNSILLYNLSGNGLQDLDKHLQWIQDGKSGKKVRYFKDYRPEFINKIEKEIQIEQQNLKTISYVSVSLLALALAGLVAYVGIHRKKVFSASFFRLVPYTGLRISLFAIVLVIGTLGTGRYFNNHFHQFPNANTGFMEDVMLILLIVMPFLFFTGYRLSVKERNMGVLSNKWAIPVSLVLFVISTILLVCIGLLLLLLQGDGPRFG